MIAQDIHDRLRAVLPASVPILLPEQQREPLDAAPVDAQGRPVMGGGERGLGTYLRQHPQGYVQVEFAQAIRSAGPLRVFWVAVACTTPTQDGCQFLMDWVSRTLIGIPGRDPGLYSEVTPGLPQPLALTSPLVWQARAVLQPLHVGGRLA